MEEIAKAARAAAIMHNAAEIQKPPFDNSIYDRVIDAREVYRRVMAGESIKDMG